RKLIVSIKMCFCVVDEQGDSNVSLIEKARMANVAPLTQPVAVIAHENDDAVLEISFLFERFENRLHEAVGLQNAVVVTVGNALQVGLVETFTIQQLAIDDPFARQMIPECEQS